MGFVCLKSHYWVDPLLEVDNHKDIMDNSLRNVDFLNNKLRRTFTMFSTMNSISEDPNVCFFID
jgi:hypothetical protein